MRLGKGETLFRILRGPGNDRDLYRREAGSFAGEGERPRRESVDVIACQVTDEVLPDQGKSMEREASERRDRGNEQRQKPARLEQLVNLTQETVGRFDMLEHRPAPYCFHLRKIGNVVSHEVALEHRESQAPCEACLPLVELHSVGFRVTEDEVHSIATAQIAKSHFGEAESPVGGLENMARGRTEPFLVDTLVLGRLEATVFDDEASELALAERGF